MKTEMRWATVSDYAMLDKSVTFSTMRGLALVIDDRTLALATIRREPNSNVQVVGLNLDLEARKYPVALHKFALFGIKTIKEVGIKAFLVTADGSIPRSDAWLERLGLTKLGDTPDGGLYRCQ